MDLNAILQKTKAKSQKITTKRKPPSIAVEERPYSFEENISKNNSDCPKKNQGQIGDNIEKNEGHNKDNIEPKLETNKRQNDDFSGKLRGSKTEIGDTIRDKIEDKIETISVQKNITIKPDNKTWKGSSLTPFSSLVGIQRKIILLIYDECKRNRSKVTQPLTMEYVLNKCGSTLTSIKKSIQRLEKKDILLRASYKLGRGGWTQYELTDQVYTEILYSENYRASLVQTEIRDKLESQLETQLETSPSSSSSNIYTTTTTTTTTSDLPEEWKIINTSPLGHIHFGQTELRNVFNKCPQSISPEIVQDSIYQFAFGLEHNPERYKNMKAPAAILVSTLCQGNRWIENHYISSEEKTKIEKETKLRNILEKKFKEPKFLEWFNGLSRDKKEELVSNGIKNSTSYMISKDIIQKEQAQKHFETVIWPTLLTELKLIFTE